MPLLPLLSCRPATHVTPKFQRGTRSCFLTTHPSPFTYLQRQLLTAPILHTSDRCVNLNRIKEGYNCNLIACFEMKKLWPCWTHVPEVTAPMQSLQGIIQSGWRPISPHCYCQVSQSIGSHENIANIKVSATVEDKKPLFYPFFF